jgi:large subunit ribosomal protein L49
MLRPTLFPRAAAPSRLLLQLAAPTTTLRSVPFCRRITTETTSQSTSSASPSTPVLTPSETSIPAPAEPAPRPAFLVSRTPSQQLPVYQLAKRGGNMKFTILKKIEGDIRALKSELKSELALEDKQIKINHVTGHLEISVRNSYTRKKARTGTKC